MLVTSQILRKYFGVRPTGVLHVGAHRAEEFDDYRSAGFGKTTWVEAQAELIPVIRDRVSPSDDLVLQGVVWSVTGEKQQFQVASNGQSSSLYSMMKHSDYYPGITEVRSVEVTTVRLDALIPSGTHFDFVNLDIQGAELEALKGLGEMIRSVHWIYSEVNREMLYDGIPMVSELDDYLGTLGFRRRVTVWTNAGWGDALYSRGPIRLFEMASFLLGLILVVWVPRFRGLELLLYRFVWGPFFRLGSKMGLFRKET